MRCDRETPPTPRKAAHPPPPHTRLPKGPPSPLRLYKSALELLRSTRSESRRQTAILQGKSGVPPTFIRLSCCCSRWFMKQKWFSFWGGVVIVSSWGERGRWRHPPPLDVHCGSSQALFLHQHPGGVQLNYSEGFCWNVYYFANFYFCIFCVKSLTPFMTP